MAQSNGWSFRKERPMANKSRAFTITMYSVNGEDLKEEMDHENSFILDQDIKGAMWQLERCPDTGRLHYQGFFVYENPRNFNAVRDKWAPHHIEKMKGRVTQNIIYCGKEETRVLGPWRYGDLPENQGKRKELDSFKDAVKEGKTWDMIIEEHSDVVAKHPGFVSLYRSKHAKKAKLTVEEFRPWQSWTLDLLKEDPHDRHVYWFYDPIGGNGKTFLSKFLVQEQQAFYMNGGKSADICFAYQGERIVIFDYMRDHKDFVGYGPIEQLKNGMFFSPKYQSVMKSFDTPHVIIFANFEPEYSKLSKDRWRVIRFTEEGIFLTYNEGDNYIENQIQ